MLDFANKVAVITGAASGIGRAIAEHCAREGMRIVLADIEAAPLAATLAELQSAGATAIAVPTDVSQRTAVEHLARQTIDTYGHVDLLVNNAGVAAGGAPWEASWNDWEWVVGVNLWGVLHGVKIFTPLMLDQNTPCHIVNTASTAGLIAAAGSAPYALTKHAVVALSESLYLSLQQRKAPIGVSVLCPGLVRTHIADAARNRPEPLRDPAAPLSPQMQAGLAAFRAMLDASMPPAEVAAKLFEAIRKDQFYVLTHPEWLEAVQLRTDKLLRMENPENPAALVAKLAGHKPQ